MARLQEQGMPCFVRDGARTVLLERTGRHDDAHVDKYCLL